MDMKLTPVKYNRTIVQPDGITNIVDTEHDYTGYQLTITEMYFKDDQTEVAKCVIRDIDRLKNRILEILKNQEQENDQEHDLER